MGRRSRKEKEDGGMKGRKECEERAKIALGEGKVSVPPLNFGFLSRLFSSLPQQGRLLQVTHLSD